MKNINKLLLILVVILSGTLIYILFFNDKNTSNENPIIEPIEDVKNETGNYKFKDIESMDKANTIEQAVENIFGNDRLFTYERSIYKDVEGIYYHDGSKLEISIEMDPKLDSRKEMIDFLHYLQFSELVNRESIEELNNEFTYVSADYFPIILRMYQSIDPGMNLPEPFQRWTIDSEKVEMMDFTNKESILNQIHSYGEFEGYNPTK